MSGSRVSTIGLCRYSLLAVPIAFAGFPLYVLAPDYYATHHGVSLSVLGFLLLGLRLFDAVLDPFIGSVSDRYRGYTSRVMAVAAALLCLGIYGLFNATLHVRAEVWFLLCIALSVTAYSVLSINLNALGSLWTKNPDEQTRIASWREACGLIGLLIAVALPAALRRYVDEAHAYFYFSLVLCAITFIAWLIFGPWLSRHISKNNAPKQAVSLFTGVTSVATNTRHFLAIYGFCARG